MSLMAIEKYFGLGESPINNLTKTKLTSQLSTCCCLETTSDLFPFFPDYFPFYPGKENYNFHVLFQEFKTVYKSWMKHT